MVEYPRRSRAASVENCQFARLAAIPHRGVIDDSCGRGIADCLPRETGRSGTVRRLFFPTLRREQH